MISESRTRGGGEGGFSLIELAVVLAIIALIVGGVLIARDLIAAATVRSQISQIESHRTAIAAFRTKYGSMPGDLHANEASALGMVSRSGERGRGDGSGIVEWCDAGCPVCTNVPFGCEVALFWSDLSFAGLVHGHFPSAEDDYVEASSFQDILGYFPEAALGKVALFPTTCSRTQLWIVALRVTASTLSSGGGGISTAPGIAGPHAAAIDTKVDDGLPLSGQVLARRVASHPLGFFCVPDLPGGLCVDTAGRYKTKGATAELCHLNFRVGVQ